MTMNIVTLGNLRRIAKEVGLPTNFHHADDTQIMKILEEACIKGGRFINDAGKEVGLMTFALEVGDVVYKRNANQRENWARIQKTYNKRMQDRQNVSVHYVNSFHETIDEIIPELDIVSAGVLFEIILHMNLNGDGYLIHDGDYIIQEDLMAFTGLGKTTLIKHLKTLKELGIVSWVRKRLTRKAHKSDKSKGIKKGDEIVYSGNVYQVNKKFHWMGKFNEEQMTMDFTKIYKVKTKELTENLSLEAKGLLYMIITKIHHQTYFLCDNPNHDLRQDENQTLEWNIKNKMMNEVNHLTRADLLRNINKSESSMKRYIKELEANAIIAPFGRGSKEKYMMNPGMFCRTDTDDHEFTYYDAIQYQFDELKKKTNKKSS